MIQSQIMINDPSKLQGMIYPGGPSPIMQISPSYLP